MEARGSNPQMFVLLGHEATSRPPNQCIVGVSFVRKIARLGQPFCASVMDDMAAARDVESELRKGSIRITRGPGFQQPTRVLAATRSDCKCRGRRHGDSQTTCSKMTGGFEAGHWAGCSGKSRVETGGNPKVGAEGGVRWRKSAEEGERDRGRRRASGKAGSASGSTMRISGRRLRI